MNLHRLSVDLWQDSADFIPKNSTDFTRIRSIFCQDLVDAPTLIAIV